MTAFEGGANLAVPMRELLVLLYHHLGAPPPGSRKRRLYTSPGMLRLHVGALRALGYRFGTFTEVMQQQQGRWAAVTFDDGFEDNLTVGLPTLTALGVPATLFVVVGDVGKRAVRWEGETGTVPGDLLDWEQLRTLARAGWEIGSHSFLHQRLAGRSTGEQRELLERSRETLADRLGAKVTSLAYPYGSYDATTVQLARDLGFRCAATTRRGKIQPREDPFQARRVILSGHRPHHLFELMKLWLTHLRLYPVRSEALLPMAALGEGAAGPHPAPR